MSVAWISFDVDYLGGSYGYKEGPFACVKNCGDCTDRHGRPQTQVLSKKEAEINTKEVIWLIQGAGIKKAYMRQCHASIIDLIHKGDVVYNIDAHHDHYSEAFTKKDVHCGNWVSWAWQHEIEVFNDENPLEILSLIKSWEFDKVHLFICTSPNYASPQTDSNLIEILHQVPCKIDVDLRK